ncbi:MAG: histidine kinase dimerization/phospho-acceptor domain-containing protein, partial [Spirochaetaceae bacterium]|nr:histidine kinase dimerization/phospho-acceptor domain-containing protein [Spirochaetaceae bacterium]
MALPESLLRSAFEQSAEPFAVADSWGVPVLWNTAFASLIRSIAGTGPDKIGGSLFEFLSASGCARFDYYAAELFLGARKSAAFDSPLRSPDGSERHMGFVLSLLEAPAPQAPIGGDLERFLLVSASDATERVLRERRLSDAKDEAEKATHTKSQFLANMSHEIRTPIQTILGVVELLQETSLDTEQAEYAGQVRFSAEVLLSLINDILDFSKIEAGRLDLEDSTFDMRAAV